MMDINRAVAFGRVVRDPESRSTAEGSNLTTFSVATNRHYEKKDGTKVEDTQFHDVVAWGRIAEIAADLQKGQRVYVEGHLRTRKWEAQDGSKRSATEIVAERIIPNYEPHQQDDAGDEATQQTA
jgi:single-strand DNA-binding protein